MATAQLIIAGIPGPTVSDEAKWLIQTIGVGGVILFKRNLGTPEQVHDLIAELRALRREPLLVCVDQEGGRVQRLRSPLTEFPPMHQLGATGDRQLAFEVAAQLGREIHAVGFDLDFAPVVDVNTNPTNPVIGDRAFGNTPADVTKMIAAFIAGLRSVGMQSCAKHFPGHGDTTEDSHRSLPRIDHALERLRQVEWPPFVASAEAKVDSIMTAHVLFPRLDQELPATLSKACLDVLREELRYDGAIISDDLEMKAITSHYGIAEAAVLAIGAGCDGLLICHTPSECERSVIAIEQNLGKGPLTRERLAAAETRMKRLLAGVSTRSAGRYRPAPAPNATVQSWLDATRVAKLADPTERAG